MEEKIDILLATYNGQKYVSEQIESILNQTYKNFNLIISDDNSNDNTPKILEEYAKKDERIILHLQEKNLGVVKNIEFLLKQVKSNYYMLSDQDDIWLNEKVEKSLEILKKENADLVFGDLQIVDENLKIINSSFSDFMTLSKKIKKYINSYKLNYLYNCITGCTILSKKKWITEILPIPTQSTHLIHDHWIGLIVSLNGKITYMPESYIKYRQHGDNQVGTEKISYKLRTLDEIREHFIKVKLGVFGVYVENNEKFPKQVQILNKQALEYFNMVQKKRNINFRKWKIFHKLYKTENFKYYILNFIIINLPILARILFNIRNFIKNKRDNKTGGK